MDPVTARRTWRNVETVHGMIYFTPDAPAAYAKLGVTKMRMGYFASRSAPMGPVAADVVIATFYNFNPALVRRSMAGVWETTTPDAMLAARLDAADSSLRRAFGDEVAGSSALAEAAAIAKKAALWACERGEGRPLFAGHASLPWPEQPHLELWHAQSLLREYRGDGHIAALTLEGLTGLEALVSHAASGDVPAPLLQASRAWSDEEWAAGIEELAARGIVESDGSFTSAGRDQRQRIEDATDRMATGPYAAIGDEAAATLLATGKKLSRLVVAAGLLQGDPSRYIDPE